MLTAPGSALLPRAAWRTLSTAADGGDAAAIEAIWQAWMWHPDDGQWELLKRWRGERALAEAAISAATDLARTASTRAAAGAFCIRRGILPHGDAERALFYALTGHAHQCRAADPDGTALAAAYEAAPESVRSAVRRVMADSGGIDIVRAIVTRRGAVNRMTDAERRYLTGELARRHDWEGLWRLALGFPLVQAASAMRHIDHGWRPGDIQGRDLYARFAAAAPGGTVPLWRDLPATTRIMVDGQVLNGAFFPDMRRVVVAVRHIDAQCRSRRQYVYEAGLPDGRTLARYDFGDQVPAWLIGLADVTIAATRNRDGTSGLYRLIGGEPEMLERPPGVIVSAVPYLDGFAVLQHYVSDSINRAFYARHFQLLFYGPQAQLLRSASLTEMEWLAARPDEAIAMTPEPECGRLLITSHAYDHDEAWLYAPFADRLTDHSFWAPPSGCIAQGPRFDWGCPKCFTAPDRLVTLGSDESVLWRIEKDRLFRKSKGRSAVPEAVTTDAAYIPQLGQIVTLGTQQGSRTPDPADRTVRYLDAESLTEIGWKHRLAGKSGHCLWGSPWGAHAAGYGRTIEVAYVTHPLASLIEQPMHEMTPADLAAVAAWLRGGPGEWPALELLSACLEYRFATDVAVGGTLAQVVSADNVAVAWSPGSPSTSSRSMSRHNASRSPGTECGQEPLA